MPGVPPAGGRFQPITYNTGLVNPSQSFVAHSLVTSSRVNIGKVKVTPSASTIGWVLGFYKRQSCAAEDKQYSTKSPVSGLYYDPATRDGAEVLEGWILPYEDLDLSKNVHTKITNLDPVARSFDVYFSYEDPVLTLLDRFKSDEALEWQGLGTDFTLGSQVYGGTIKLYRNGTRLVVNQGFTLAGQVVTLTVPLMEGETLTADYVVNQ